MLELSPRYKILRDSRLSALDTSAARAYQAIDVEQAPGQGSSRPAVAFLYQPGNTLPAEQIRAFEDFDVPGMIRLIDHGVVPRDNDPGRDFALIVEPLGEPLARSLVQPFEALSDERIVVTVVRPLLPVLREIESRRAAHRAIRPTNIFFGAGRESVLGPPMLSPPAQDQPTYLEPLESAMTDPRARNIGTFADDLFAFGVTLLMLATGRNPLKGESEAKLMLKRLDSSSYEAMIGGMRLTTAMTEVVRGLVVDNIRERWGLRELTQWATEGRRPNPQRVALPKVAGRPIKVGPDEALSARSVAYGIARNWDHGGKLLTSEEFQTWVRRSLADEVVVERVTKVTRGSQDTTIRERSDKLIPSALVALDPQAPFRYRAVSTTLEGLPNLLAGVLADAEGEAETKGDISQMITSGHWSGWAQAQGTSSPEGTRVKSLLERQRTVATSLEPGQGIERCLYEFSPFVPCLSPLVIESCVVNLSDLLVTLDRLPREAFGEDFLADRHILAFLAARSTKITDTLMRQSVGRRSALQRLVHQVRMLALVQSGSKSQVSNLTTHLADLLRKTAEAEIRGSELKEMVLRDLEQAAPLGRIEALLKTLEESGALDKDRQGFEAARADYVRTQKRLAELKDERAKVLRRSGGLGPQIAALIGLASGLVAIAVMALMGVGF